MWRAFDASAVALRKDMQNVLGLKARARAQRSINAQRIPASPPPPAAVHACARTSHTAPLLRSHPPARPTLHCPRAACRG
jgi:hypothetical protein